MITTEGIEWDSDDAANFRAFLETKTGAKILPKILESTPPLLPGGGINEILIRSGEVRAVKIFADAFLALTVSATQTPVEPQNIAYPSLTDDKEWNDGQKLQPSQE